MELGQLRIFLAVAEELHFGRAAEKLHLAQPPVSRSVAQLERSLKARLFDRSTRSVRLTAAGAQLVDAARDILQRVDAAERAVLAGERGDIGRVSIAFAGASTHTLIGSLSRELRRRHRGIIPELKSRYFSEHALEGVTRGEVDLALGRWDDLPAELSVHDVLDETLVVAVPAGHPLAGSESISFDDLAGEPFVALLSETGSVLNDRLRTLCFAAGYEPTVIQTAPDTWTLLALVGADVACTLTVDSVKDNVADPHLRFLSVRDEYAPIRLQMIWRPDNDNPVLPHVLTVARDVFTRVEDLRGH